MIPPLCPLKSLITPRTLEVTLFVQNRPTLVKQAVTFFVNLISYSNTFIIYFKILNLRLLLKIYVETYETLSQ